MVWFRRTILILAICLLSIPAASRQVEGVSPYSSYAQKIERQAKIVKSQVEKKYEEVRSAVTSWWKSVKPKSEEEKAKEVRVAAEVERQKKKAQEFKEIEESLPTYQSKQADTYKNFLNKTESDLKLDAGVFSEKNGRQGSTDIPKTKSGVPVYTKTRTLNLKSVPRLDIGQEPEISRKQFLVDGYQMTLDKYDMAKALRGPKKLSKKQLEKWTKKEIVVAGESKKLKRQDFGIAEIVTEEKIEKTLPPSVATLDEYKPYTKFSKNDLKMLSALLLYAQGDKCHLVAGIFDDLSKDKAHKREANFHLGVCSVNMGFLSEAVQRLMPIIIDEDTNYSTIAIQELAKQLPREYEVPFSKVVRNVKNKALIEGVSNLDRVNYLVAKGAYTEGKYNTANEYALKVSEKSKEYPSARYLIATIDYNLKRPNEAVKKLKELLAWMKAKGKTDTNLLTLVNINLARIHFQQNKFKTAIKYYNKVDKKHPLWVQGLIEQGWAQVMQGDYPGAIGNMYSLHSPYFKAVYMPESWVVRSIGYINICQYGDAYNSLSKMENKYRQWHTKAKKYITTKKSKKNYYDTTVNYLKGKSTKDVDGLPYQVIREMARQRDYLNFQESINEKVDERSQYSFVYRMIKEDKAKMKWRIRKAGNRIKELKSKIAKSKKNKALRKNLVEWKQQVAFEKQLIVKLNFQLAAYERGRKSFLRLKASADKRIKGEMYSLRGKAGNALRGSLKNIRKQLSGVLDNNEFLRYEVFAGSGENIRYQVAAGVDSGKRVKANAKPPKSLSWQFQGEYWEDEIGSYRSTLKNNCPNAVQNAAYQEGQ